MPYCRIGAFAYTKLNQSSQLSWAFQNAIYRHLATISTKLANKFIRSPKVEEEYLHTILFNMYYILCMLCLRFSPLDSIVFKYNAFVKFANMKLLYRSSTAAGFALRCHLYNVVYWFVALAACMSVVSHHPSAVYMHGSNIDGIYPRRMFDCFHRGGKNAAHKLLLLLMKL